MATDGIEGLLIETHNWGKTVAFWQGLGFVLEFVPDDSLSRQYLGQATDRQVASDPSTVPRAPGFATALEEQLGLRLQRVPTPRQFIVIDAVERPTPN